MPASIHIDFEKFTDPGLYLLFDDGLFLTLTRKYIDTMKRSYLQDPKLLPVAVREAVEYAPCSVCPKRETALICHAIPTVFPFLEELNRFVSHNKVLAVFRPEPLETSGDDSVLHTARTTVHRALQYVSILSLMNYCEVGRAYFKYFAGVIPFMDPMLIIERVYLNIYWDLHGDLPAINALIEKMRHEMNITVRCQMDRLRLLCQSDAFLNAFVNTHIVTQFMESDMETLLRKQFAGRKAPEAGPDEEGKCLPNADCCC